MSKKSKYINGEISWLSFNKRVLQEVCNKEVPLIERIKFLSIFSSNLDEFFRVRVAALVRYSKINRLYRGDNPKEILSEIKKQAAEQQIEVENIYNTILKPLLEKENIFIIDEKQLNKEQINFLTTYFHENILPDLSPILFTHLDQSIYLKDPALYFIISLAKKEGKSPKQYSLLEIPKNHPRFVILPNVGNKKYIILLDDIIRYFFKDIFGFLGYNHINGYTIKIIRDAELDIDSGLSISMLESMSKSLKARKRGSIVRLTYDAQMPKDLLNFVFQKFKIKTQNIIPGGRYHNFKDFNKFPNIGRPELEYSPTPPLYLPDISLNKSFFTRIAKENILVSVPYQSFDYSINFLREAALDPDVTTIRITLYRMANKSRIINALKTASRNGKKVCAMVELKARFDEESNIYWTQELEEAGVKVLHGLPEFKVHSKICLITRQKRNQDEELFAMLGTGNYNENTARIYGDYHYFTSSKTITRELNQLLDNLDKNIIAGTYRNIIVSPINLRRKIEAFIDKEIETSKKGYPAYIVMKMNSLTDTKIIDKLYEANKAGVKIQLIVRGMCRLIPNKKGLSENISVISIVDKFLEHARVYIFCNKGTEKIYLSSADMMPRNIDYRVEVTFPITDIKSKKIIRDMIDIQLKDNVKARIIDEKFTNSHKQKENPDEPDIRSQMMEYKYFKEIK